jgi:hypothetical protein
MKLKMLSVALVLLASAWRAPAQTAEPANAPSEGAPVSALQTLKGYLQSNPPPLNPFGARQGWILLGSGILAGIGCAQLALIPTYQDWGPEEEPGQYRTNAFIGGALQGSMLNALIGGGLAEVLFPRLDLRAEYGRLLDLAEPEQERRAYVILRAVSRRAKQRNIAAPLLMIAATAIPAGTYYLGEAIAGANPNAEGVALGYLVGIALGALLPVAMWHDLEGKSPEVTLFETVRNPGGREDGP